MTQNSNQAEIALKLKNFKRIADSLGLPLTKLNAVHIRYEAASKFVRAKEPFAMEGKGLGAAEKATAIKLLERVGEFLWLETIFSELGPKVDLSKFVPKLIAGSAFHSFYFELLTAVHFNRMGFHLNYGEPDWIISKKDLKVAVACKCIKSRKTLMQRLREARDQIRKSELPGVVMLDIGQLHCPQFEVHSVDEGWSKIEIQTSELIQPLRKKIEHHLKPDVCGVVYHNRKCVGIPIQIKGRETDLQAHSFISVAPQRLKPNSQVEKIFAELRELDF